MKLRSYQQESVDNVIAYWQSGGGHPLVVLPTGTGKSLVAAAMMTQLRRDYGARVLLATHVSELVSQNYRALSKYWPEAPRGIYHAGLGKRDGAAPICIAGIHSIFRTPEVVGERDVLLIDEAHLLSHKDDGMYRKLIAHFEKANPGFRVCGLTATPYRMSTGMLIEDYGDHAALFDDIVYEMPILKAINQGWLVPILPYVSPERFDVSKVKTSAGDYNKKQLQDAVDKDEISARIAAEVAAVMQNKQRSTGLTFASGIQHAQHLCEHYNRLGITAETITEKTKEREKADILERARKGQLQMVVGVGTITTGIDIPNVDILVCARPTKSKGLWTQILGRGTRLSPETGKTDCLLLDFTDNSILIGPLDTLDGHKEKGEQGAPPQRACPDCQHVHHISLRNCPMCNHEYPAHELKVSAMSRAGPVFSTQEEPVWLDVDSIRVKKHVKANKAPSLRIEYLCGFRSVYHWVPLEHETAHGFAKQWWRRNSINDGDPPETVDEALQRIGELRVPGRIQVTKDGSFEKVTSHDYSIPPGRWTPPIEKPMSIEDAYRRER